MRRATRVRLAKFGLRILRGKEIHCETPGENRLKVTAKGRLTAKVEAPRDVWLCRLGAPAGEDVAQLAVGEVESTLCDALFSPSIDTAYHFRGRNVCLSRPAASDVCIVSAQGVFELTVIPHYYRDRLQHPWYRPLDKSVFHAAPSGWCSWYIYQKNIDEAKIVRNMEWLRDNLKPFGLQVCQVDDGWQGNGYGHGGNRDWFRPCRRRFPHGMKWLAGRIRAAGMTPGLWLIPNTQSDEALFRANPNMFVRHRNGRSFNELTKPLPHSYLHGKEKYYRWSGRYLLDPTHPDTAGYLDGLMRTLCDAWGYGYVKIDAQGYMVGLYDKARALLHDPSRKPAEVYRLGLKAIRRAMGKKRFLLNCTEGWDSTGFCDGIRTGGDVHADVGGLETAADYTYRRLYINGIAWWADPDVVCVREPLTLEQARAWVTLIAITGQAFLASDDMPALPRERVELLKRAFPVLPVRPMELFDLKHRPQTFDLKINVPGVGEWDVVAVFNWSRRRSKQGELKAADLGIRPHRSGFVFFDVWREKLLSAGGDTVCLSVPPMGCRLVAVRRVEPHPQVLSTSRHVSAGAADLKEVRWNARRNALCGVSEVVAGEPYRVHFSIPVGYRVKSKGVAVDGGLGTFVLRSERQGTAKWCVEFKRGKDS